MDDFCPWMVVVHSWMEEFVCLFVCLGPDINIQAGAELCQAQYKLGQGKPAVA